MKNLIIGPAFPLRGGIANFNEALCQAFLKSGNDSQIISFTLQYPSFLFPGKTQYDTSGKSPEGIKITPLINSVNPFTWFKVASYIKKQGPDYVVFRYWLPFMAPCLGTIAKLVKKNSNIKVLAICDNVIPHEKRIGDEFLTRFFVKQCDGFVAMSKSVLDDLQKITNQLPPLRGGQGRGFKFLPHPIYNIFGEKVEKEKARQHLGLSPPHPSRREGETTRNNQEKYILFFGFIRKYKGLDLLLEAMADERIKKLNVKLIIAGEYYEDKSFYEEIIRKYDLENSLVLRTDFIPSEEVRYYFCAADLVAQPYRSATQSGVTQIAYHFNRPMLVTDVGGLSEIVPDGKAGYVCDVNSRSIADSLFDFYQNQREAEFSLNAEKEKQRFSWESFVNGIEELVRSL